MYVEEFGEFGEHLFETIPSEAPQGERVETIPQGSRAKRLEAPNTL